MKLLLGGSLEGVGHTLESSLDPLLDPKSSQLLEERMLSILIRVRHCLQDGTKDTFVRSDSLFVETSGFFHEVVIRLSDVIV